MARIEREGAWVGAVVYRPWRSALKSTTHTHSSPRAVDLFFSCKSPFQIFIHLRIQDSAQNIAAALWVVQWYRTPSRGPAQNNSLQQFGICVSDS